MALNVAALISFRIFFLFAKSFTKAVVVFPNIWNNLILCLKSLRNSCTPKNLSGVFTLRFYKILCQELISCLSNYELFSFFCLTKTLIFSQFNLIDRKCWKRGQSCTYCNQTFISLIAIYLPVLPIIVFFQSKNSVPKWNSMKRCNCIVAIFNLDSFCTYTQLI